MPDHGDRRRARRWGPVLAGLCTVLTLSACGTPAHLDHDEQVAFGRECASLVERNVAEAKHPRQTQLGDQTLTLDDPASFYAELERLRGASTYNLHDARHDADTARQPLDDCNPKLPLLSSILKPKSSGSTSSPASSTTTTTTTTVTVPGS